MTRKSRNKRPAWLIAVALALALAAGACALNTAPDTIPQPRDDNDDRDPPIIGLLVPQGHRAVVLL